MKRDSQRLFKYIQFLGFVTILQIQITEIFIVKLNSNNCRRASYALGVHGRSRVVLFKFQHFAGKDGPNVACILPDMYNIGCLIDQHSKSQCMFVIVSSFCWWSIFISYRWKTSTICNWNSSSKINATNTKWKTKNDN